MATTMDYSRKLAYQSNYWYNDGLQKAKIHDLSGAITSLRKSLQYNRENVTARNLLGLIYYGRGEVAEALVEWIISKSLRNSENIANYYISKVQKNPNKLEQMNQAIQKYNQSLIYCHQDGEDLAIIQLKKVVRMHPTFLKAYQLLALLFLKTQQYSKAYHVLKRAHKIDRTDELTLRYMHELSLHKKTEPKRKGQKEETVTYKLGNETIIQPLSVGAKDASPMHTILNIGVGLVVGAAIIWFLAVPAAEEASAVRFNDKVTAFSDQIEAQKGQISALKRELEGYRSTSDNLEEEQENAVSAQESYEALLKVETQYAGSSTSDNDMVTGMLSINRNALGAGGQEKYDDIANELYPRACEKKYKSGKANYEAANYQDAITDLEQVAAMDEGYEEGNALLYLAHSYQKIQDDTKAKELYNKVIELYPNTDIAREADAGIKGEKTAE